MLIGQIDNPLRGAPDAPKWQEPQTWLLVAAVAFAAYLVLKAWAATKG